MAAPTLQVALDEPTDDDLLRFLTVAKLDNGAISRLAGFASRLSPQYRARLIERFSSIIGAVSETMT